MRGSAHDLHLPGVTSDAADRLSSRRRESYPAPLSRSSHVFVLPLTRLNAALKLSPMSVFCWVAGAGLAWSTARARCAGQ